MQENDADGNDAGAVGLASSAEGLVHGDARLVREDEARIRRARPGQVAEQDGDRSRTYDVRAVFSVKA